METCKKLKCLLDKELKINQVIGLIEQIVDLKGIKEKFEKFYFQDSFIQAFVPSVYLEDIEYNEDFEKYVARIEYNFGDDDNQVFVDCEVLEEAENDLECRVKVIDIWT